MQLHSSYDSTSHEIYNNVPEGLLFSSASVVVFQTTVMLSYEYVINVLPPSGHANCDRLLLRFTWDTSLGLL